MIIGGNTLSTNDWMTICVGLGAIVLAAGWRLLDLLLPKGRVSKWVYDNTVEADQDEEEVDE